MGDYQTKCFITHTQHFKVCCSLAQWCPTFCDPTDCRRSGFPVLHYLPEFAQTHVHWVNDPIPPSHPLSPHSPTLNLFTALGSFPKSQAFASGGQRIGASHSASVLPTLNIQGWFPLGLTGLISVLTKWLLRVFSSTTIWKHQFFGAQPYGSSLISVHDYWKIHSFY